MNIEHSGNLQAAVIGCGYWGKNLVRNFNELGSLAMVCDSFPEALELAATIAPDAKLVEDFQEVLKSDVDCVVIASQAETHHELVLQALHAGKDVFVEKPLALTYDQGAELVKVAQERELVLMVGHVMEYHPAIVKLMETINSGVLGNVYYIYSNRLSLGKVRREENILWSFAPHDIALTLRIVGSLPFQVTASGGGYVQPNIADVTVTNMLFDNGVRAHIYVSWLHPFKEQRLVVIGSKKMISFDDVGKKLILYDKRVEIQSGDPTPISGDGEELEFPDDEPLRLECEAFLNSVRTRRPPLTDGRSGLQVLRVLQAAQRSLIMNAEPVVLLEETYV